MALHCERRSRRSFRRVATGLNAARRAARSAAEQSFGKEDRAGTPREPGPDREAERRREAQIALDAEAERQFDACDFGKAETSEFGGAETEIGKAEQCVAVLIKLGREPGRGTKRAEQFDDGHGVEALALRLGDMGADGIGAKREMQGLGQEDHATNSCFRAATWRPSSQSAALLAALAARKIARLSSRSTSSQQAR